MHSLQLFGLKERNLTVGVQNSCSRLSNELLLNFHFFFDFVIVFHFNFFAYKKYSQHPSPILFGCRIYHSHVSSLWMNYQIICEKVSLCLIQIDSFRNFKIVFELWKPFTEWNWIKVRKYESLTPESGVFGELPNKFFFFFFASSFRSFHKEFVTLNVSNANEI